MADEREADQDLVRQIAAGDEKAFGILYDRYQGPLYRFAWHMSGNSATAEEITQELFMLVIRGPKYDPAKGSVAAYLFGIVRNLARRVRERETISVPLMDEQGESMGCVPKRGEEADVLAKLCQQELVEILRRAVLSLPDQYREVVVLCEIEQMSYGTAAEILQCSPGTIASRLHRARALLKSKIDSQRTKVKR